MRLPNLAGATDGLSEVIARFEARGVHCRKPVFRSLHRYLDLDGFPTAEEAERTTLSIPLFPSLTDEEVAHIQVALRSEWP